MEPKLGRSRMLAAGLLAGLLALAPAAPAAAAKPSRATVSSCSRDSLTITAAVAAAKGERVGGARLELQFAAVPFSGAVLRGRWTSAGSKRSVTLSRRFKIGPGIWTGSVRYRFRRGGRTVASGVVRTGSARVGRSAGTSICFVRALPGQQLPGTAVDRDPPTLSITPGPDQAWKRGPVTVNFHASDELSGVAAVDYTVNGTPGRGRSLTLSSEGEYDIRAMATDLVGNVSAPAATFVRIDGGPPTAPGITLPFPDHSSDNTPRAQWSAASDSGSGVQRYVVSFRNTATNVVTEQPIPAGTHTTTAPQLPNGPYEVLVTAYDGTQPDAYFAVSAPAMLTVDNVIHTNDFSSCPGGYTLGGTWECGNGMLFHDDPPRDCLSGNPQTSVTTSPIITYPAVVQQGETMRLRFTRAFATSAGFDDSGTVEVLVDGVVPPSGSKTYTSTTASGSDSITFQQPTPGASNIRFRFTYVLDGGPLLCDPPPANFTIDDLRLERSPLP